MKGIFVGMEGNNIEDIKQTCKDVKMRNDVEIEGEIPYECEHPITRKTLRATRITIENDNRDNRALKELVSKLSDVSDYVAIVKLNIWKPSQ